jgi:hypothetical protein
MKISIIGAGPASLMVATQLVHSNHEVTIYEQKKTPGRKFLVAGKGGFNLTHSGEISDFVSFFSNERIKQIIPNFTNNHFIDWLDKIGISTYIGTSGKVFPDKSIKPYQVLERWINYLKEGGIKFEFNKKMIDFSNNSVTFDSSSGLHTIETDKIVLGLGGISWSKTGSDGNWMKCFKVKNIQIIPFKVANCGIHTDLPTTFLAKWNGHSIKNSSVSIKNFSKKGEIRITKYGLEGAPIYYLIPNLRNQDSLLTIDFKPSFDLAKIEDILGREKNFTVGLKKLNLPALVIELIKLCLTKDEFLNLSILSKYIKQFPIGFDSFRQIDEAISVAGGVSWEEIDNNFSLIKYPNVYLVGEMLDWEAPTGGYLIHGAVATGYHVGRSIFS